MGFLTRLFGERRASSASRFPKEYITKWIVSLPISQKSSQLDTLTRKQLLEALQRDSRFPLLGYGGTSIERNGDHIEIFVDGTYDEPADPQRTPRKTGKHTYLCIDRVGDDAFQYWMRSKDVSVST